MDSNKNAGIEDNAGLLQQISTLLTLTLPEIRNRYSDYPYCLIDYFEREITEKSLEVRFDKEEITMTCTFNSMGDCNAVYLFPDKNEFIENFVTYLKEKSEFDFIRNRWKMSAYFIKIGELCQISNDIYLKFYR